MNISTKDIEIQIREVCDEMCNFLIDKNRAYGNAAAEPLYIFSEADVIERIEIRLDDKLNRIKNGNEYEGDDTEKDIIGYLILKRCIERIREGG